ncbi:SRPBCC family protein, partial [Bacteroidota bacterium]
MHNYYLRPNKNLIKTISTDITINAGMDKAWEILSDFPSYPEWNPFITQISGELKTGSKL